MRKTWVVAGAAVLVAVTATAVVAVMSSAKQATPAAQHPPASTVKVEKRELSAVVSHAGTLTYRALSGGSPYSVINRASGIYTKLPALGTVISQGQELYRVNDSPVVLLYGSTPAYRTLAPGATGADVAELNADLVALGYATSAQLSPTSASYGWATVTAVEKLQAALGVTQTGRLAFGQAVFEPTAVRVTTVSAQLGGSTQTGQTVMQATSTTRQVQMALAASQQTEVAVGDKVTITLPNNTTTPGVVSSVGTVATCPSSSAAPGPGACSPTITVDITPSDPAATGTWDQAPVRVGITTASVPSALAVPVTALLAQSARGYAVEVVGAGGVTHLVPVSLGLFDDADGLVQVTGSGLAAGQEVVVPST
jgi:peptidoglycan hydrolase-like protein with peptidoglycan-binding domain